MCCFLTTPERAAALEAAAAGGKLARVSTRGEPSDPLHLVLCVADGTAAHRRGGELPPQRRNKRRASFPPASSSAAAPPSTAHPGVTGEAPFTAMFTSGSTGSPKPRWLTAKNWAGRNPRGVHS